jgi:hypothetical protein
MHRLRYLQIVRRLQTLSGENSKEATFANSKSIRVPANRALCVDVIRFWT